MSSTQPQGADGHYFSESPETPEKPRYVEFTVAGRWLRLHSAAGVFSGDRLDPGTAVLLRKAPLPTGPGDYLDLGAGYGPIACALATQTPTGRVYAVDVNTRALRLVRRNADELGLADRLTAATPEQLPADLRFDQIWSNPPIRIGKPALRQLLATWLPRLKPDGVAWLVVARNLGGDSLADWLTGEGWRVQRHASQKGYRIFAVRPAEVPGHIR
ncbi:MAG: class I SAM-dependent methyltransferase [Micromonosporaceae bacterium]